MQYLRRHGKKGIYEACTEFAARLEDIQLPLSPNDPVTKQLISILIDEKLHELLDSAFGPMLPNRVEAPYNPWFDAVDNKANASRDTEALLKLFSPTGRLFRILVELTVIDPDFFNKVRENWKNEYAPNVSDGRDLDTPFGPAWFYIPLSVLCSTAFLMLAEPFDLNIVDLPVDRVPPFFTLPVWRPPLTTEEIHFSHDTKDRYMCVSVGPAMYLILRMLSFMPFAVSQYSVFADLAPPTDPSWTDKLLGRNPEKDDGASRPHLAAYFELVSRYVSHLCPKQPFSAKPAVDEVLGAAMMHAISMVWQRYLPPPSESDRIGSRDLGQISILLHGLPIFEQLLRVVPTRREDSQTPMGSHLIRTFDEVLRPSTSIYRTTLRVLRQTLVCLPNTFRFPAKHLLSVLRLVAALIDTGAARADSAEALVVTRYEVFSVILADLFDVLIDCSHVFLGAHTLNTEIATALAAVISPLADSSVRGCLEVVSSEIQSNQRLRNSAAAQVQAALVLTWAQDDLGFAGNTRSGFVPVTKGKVALRAANLRDVLQQQQPTDVFRAAITALECAFPDAMRHRGHPTPLLAPARPEDSSMLDVSLSTQSSDASGAAPTGRGRGGHSSVRYPARRIRLRDPSVPLGAMEDSYLGSDNKPYCSDIVYTRGARLPPRTHEMPSMLFITEMLDSLIQWIQDAREVSRGATPRCPRGHRMSLEESVRTAPLWLCESCGFRADTPTLSTAMGYAVEPETIESQTASEPAVCERCGLFLEAPRKNRLTFRRFFVPLTDSFLCPDCAVRPYPRISLRLLASRRTYVAMAILFALVLFCSLFVGAPRGREASPAMRIGLDDVDDML